MRRLCVFDLDGTLIPYDSTREIQKHIYKRTVYGLLQALVLYMMMRILRKTFRLPSFYHRLFESLFICYYFQKHPDKGINILAMLILRGLTSRNTRYVWMHLRFCLENNGLVVILTKTLLPRYILESFFNKILSSKNIKVFSEGICKSKCYYTPIEKEKMVIRLLGVSTFTPHLFASDNINEVRLAKKFFRYVVYVKTSKND